MVKKTTVGMYTVYIQVSNTKKDKIACLWLNTGDVNVDINDHTEYDHY